MQIVALALITLVIVAIIISIFLLVLDFAFYGSPYLRNAYRTALLKKKYQIYDYDKKYLFILGGFGILALLYILGHLQ